MKHYLTIGLSALAGIAVGGVAVQTLHAQAKPPVYQVSLQDISNPDAFSKEFVPTARETIRKHGGKSLGSSAPVVLEGKAPSQRVVVNQWASMEQAKAWFSSPEYQKAREIGNKYGKFTIVLVEGVVQ